MKNTADKLLLLMFIVLISASCIPHKAQVNDPTELKTYVESANRTKSETGSSEGSLLIGSAYRSNLFRDAKARYVDDVVTIRVSETTQAVSSADAKHTKATSASAGFDHLLGAEKAIKELPTMLSGNGSSSFEGKGSTSRATTLETSLTARVIDVLPNGYLVVEGMREIHINNENQSISLRGVIRPEDINSSNIVLSSAVAQMSVRLQGKGVVSQPIKPGWLFKILNGILPF
jgi:flagellar L-ring protein FlgH